MTSSKGYPNLFFIVPAFNEEKRIGKGEYFVALSAQIRAKFLFVNDGSTDQTAQLIDHLAQQIEGHAIHLEQNSGKADAIRAGALFALDEFSPDFIGFMDSDGAFSLESARTFIEKAIETLEGNELVDAVLSSRIKLSGRNVHRRATRHYISRVIITSIGLFVPNLPYDSQSGLKLFRNNQRFRKAISEPFSTKWFFDIELMLRTNWLEEHKVWEEPVLAWRDVEGSHLTWKKFPTLLKEIWTISKLGRANRSISKD